MFGWFRRDPGPWIDGLLGKGGRGKPDDEAAEDGDFSAFAELQEEARRKRRARERLVRMGRPALDALVARLGPDDLVNLELGQTLAGFGAPAREALLQRVENGPLEQALPAARALWEFEDDALPALPRLLQRLATAPPRLAGSLAHLIGRIGVGAAVAIPELLRLVEEGPDAARASALWALGQLELDPPRLAALALVWIREGVDPDIEAAAIALLDGSGADPSPVAGRLAARLQSRPPLAGLEQVHVLRLLGRCREEQAAALAVPALRRVAEDAGRNASQRVAALEQLRELGTAPAETVPALLTLLDEAPEPVCDALCALGPAGVPAVPALIRFLEAERDYWDGCWAAVDALGAIGPGAAAAIPILREMIRHDSPLVRGRAEKALAAVAGGGPA